jgi:DNA mismatch endonuclease (patch repair protein)
MANKISKEIRSRIMPKIRSKNTKPEIILRKILKGKGFSYQPNLFGRPDFAHYKKKMVVFLDGCFWHQCPIHSKIPKQNSNYWIPKLERNKIRSREVSISYKNSGWKVIRIWEHDIVTNRIPTILFG